MRECGRVLIGSVALLAVVLLVPAQVMGQEEKGAPPSSEAAMADMMAKWQALNAKGPEHEKFEQMVGTWETETKSWMFPGTEPMVSTGTAEFRLLFNGRYIEQKFKCKMGEAAYEALGLEGYDRIKKKYVSIWMDNMSTGIFMMEGTVDESGKVYTYHGKMDDPMTGQKDKAIKSVAREIDANNVVFAMYDTLPDGTQFKNMEITYTRKE